jgi:hypothetical protein
MQLASAEEDEAEKGKGASGNEGMGTTDILNKLYQDVERDFQVRLVFKWEKATILVDPSD